MKRLWWLLVFIVPACRAQTATYNGVCTQGAGAAIVSGLKSTNQLQTVFPSCTVTVYLTGTLTRATLYSDGSNTPLANPFTAQTNGLYRFYAAQGAGLDVTMSGVGMIPTSLTDVLLGGGAPANASSLIPTLGSVNNLAVVMIGTSIDCGQYSSNAVCTSNSGRQDSTNSGGYTDWSQLLLNMTALSGHVGSYRNYATPGYTTPQNLALYNGGTVYGMSDPHTAITASTAAGSKCLLFFGGQTNDLNSVASDADLTTLEANISQLWAKAKADGCYVATMTTMPHTGSLTVPESATASSFRYKLNTWMAQQRGTGVYDLLIDLAFLFQSTQNAVFFNEGTHPLTPGQIQIANFVNSSMWKAGADSPQMPAAYSRTATPYADSALGGAMNQVFHVDGTTYQLPSGIAGGTSYYIFNANSAVDSTITAIGGGGVASQPSTIHPLMGCTYVADVGGGWWETCGTQHPVYTNASSNITYSGAGDHVFALNSGVQLTSTAQTPGTKWTIFEYGSTAATFIAAAGSANGVTIPPGTGITVVNGGANNWYLSTPTTGTLPQTGTVTIGGSSLAAGACITGDIGGLSFLNYNYQVTANPEGGISPGDAFDWSAYVKNGLTATVRVCNHSPSSATPPSLSYYMSASAAASGGGGGGASGTVNSVSGATSGGFAVSTTNATTNPVVSVAVDSTHVLPINTGSATTYLNGAGAYTTPASSAGSGTVTSVALTMPGTIFNSTVPGSPVTTAGTLAPTLATQTANTVLAGPASGSAAAPTFRALVYADGSGVFDAAGAAAALRQRLRRL